MYDPYLYEDVPVLKNKLEIKNEKTLDHIEAEQSRANMMLLYDQGFQNFSPAGLCEIHHFLFGDIYDWAGQYRIINIEKKERLLAGRSVWYSNDENIPEDLEIAFANLRSASLENISREQFVNQITRLFPAIWRVHPFREGNTRSVVMMMTFFCGTLWVLYGSGSYGRQCRLCSGRLCNGLFGSVFGVRTPGAYSAGCCLQGAY